ncbi:sulfotransferase family protein [Alloyangia pacifica]|uniref:sulfotransferase family protein n=1 Tax=Alloyangia pacifica TaxID=311180 RepID=UPI001CD76B16|nr:sulfotransferase [Alloyangia pacifica]MCA0998665.1 sulfotransferase [Alloyangia pacifica]
MKNKSRNNSCATAYAVPNLIIAGAQKAGTTDVAIGLSKHPQVHLPPEKELLFFSNKNWARNIYQYIRKFPIDPDVKYWVDATPGYFWTGPATDFAVHPGAAPKGVRMDPSAPLHDLVGDIRSTLGPNLKIIIILRHPVRRAVSAFFHHFRMGRVRTTDRIRNIGYKYGIIDIGMYAYHLRRYLSEFPRENMKIMFFEEYVKDPKYHLEDICSWLALDPSMLNGRSLKDDANPGIKVRVENGAIRVQGGISQIRDLKNDRRFAKMIVEEPPIVEEEDISFLNNIFSDDISDINRMLPKSKLLWKELSLENYHDRG